MLSKAKTTKSSATKTTKSTKANPEKQRIINELVNLGFHIDSLDGKSVKTLSSLLTKANTGVVFSDTRVEEAQNFINAAANEWVDLMNHDECLKTCFNNLNQFSECKELLDIVKQCEYNDDEIEIIKSNSHSLILSGSNIDQARRAIFASRISDDESKVTIDKTGKRVIIGENCYKILPCEIANGKFAPFVDQEVKDPRPNTAFIVPQRYEVTRQNTVLIKFIEDYKNSIQV
jgi:hypothetical protein